MVTERNTQRQRDRQTKRQTDVTRDIVIKKVRGLDFERGFPLMFGSIFYAFLGFYNRNGCISVLNLGGLNPETP